MRVGTKPTMGGEHGAGLELVEGWFASRGWTPWEFQRRAWRAFLSGRSGLIQVSTGAGKTYGAFGGPLAMLCGEHARGVVRRGLRVLYVSPLRAVSRDVELALAGPVIELGLPMRVESRTGDTPDGVRRRQQRSLPEVLVTTPESLTLLLTRPDAAAVFAGCDAVILDEWHELVASKRGSQTELALARLRAFSPDVRTWAVSATLPNAAVAARAAVGARETPVIVDGDMPRPVELDVLLPREGRTLPWAGHLGLVMAEEVAAALDPASPSLVFTNTRSQAERWYGALRMLRPDWEPVMALHHGSIDREERTRVEQGLKDGSVRIVVATSSLDLGVDFAPLERVLQVGSPKGIARLVQRAGRSSHRPRTPCRVTCVPTHMMEVVEFMATREALVKREIEPREPAPKPIDVLVQHLVTCALGGGFTRRAMLEEVRGAFSFEGLAEEEFDWALSMVTHGGASLRAYENYHKVVERDGVYTVPDRRVAALHRLNVGTITSDGTIEVKYTSGRSLGRIEEDFIARLREGQRFVFAGKVLTLARFRDLVAYVRPATGKTTFTPIWSGTRLPISESLSQAIRRSLAESRVEAGDALSGAIRPFIEVQHRVSAVPRADETLVEIARTREGHHLFVFPFEGRLVNAGLGAVLALRLSRLAPATFSVASNDYGVELLSAEPFDFGGAVGPGLFTSEGLASDAAESANTNFLAKLQFREIARVSGLVVQSYPGRGRTARQLQAGSSLIFDVLSEFEPDNLLLRQATSEVMSRHYEEGRLARTFHRIRSGPLRIVEAAKPSPLAFPLLIERLAGRLSSRSLLERIEAMKQEWMRGCEEASTHALGGRGSRRASRSS